jgi:hypothetical protein
MPAPGCENVGIGYTLAQSPLRSARKGLGGRRATEGPRGRADPEGVVFEEQAQFLRSKPKREEIMATEYQTGDKIPPRRAL